MGSPGTGMGWCCIKRRKCVRLGTQCSEVGKQRLCVWKYFKLGKATVLNKLSLAGTELSGLNKSILLATIVAYNHMRYCVCHKCVYEQN